MPSNSQTSYQIESYQVTLPGGEVKDRKRIIYYRGDEEISREVYSNQPISDNFKDPTDPTEVVNRITFTFDCSEDWNGCDAVSDRFIKRAGGNYTNITPFVAWIDCALIGVSLSSREPQEWEAIIYVDDEEAVSLKSEGNRVRSNRYEYKISKDQRISVFVKGTDIQNPGVQLILTAVLPVKNSDKPEEV